MKPPGCLTLQGLCQRLPPVELDEPLHCRLRVLQSGREAVHRFRARLMRGVARRDDALHGWEGILLEELVANVSESVAGCLSFWRLRYVQPLAIWDCSMDARSGRGERTAMDCVSDEIPQREWRLQSGLTWTAVPHTQHACMTTSSSESVK